jgi:hypothetical protein
MVGIYGEEDFRVSEAKLQLARVHWDLCAETPKSKAAPLEAGVLSLRKCVLSEQDSATIRTIVQWSRGLRLMGRMDEAERAQREALRCWQRYSGNDAVVISQSKEELAATLIAPEVKSHSLQLRREVVEELKKSLGVNHWMTIRATASCGSVR